ncbi:MAG: LOG family protein [Bradymonadaceae bacterium]|nr:LOG family protein [Lujinxingiaceae bacterium]
MKDAATKGVWGEIAEVAGPTNKLAQALVTELDEGLLMLDAMPPAVTFFGGARVQPDDPYYAMATAMGELLAEIGVPPRTGAGPGIMAAVPDGFRQRLGPRDDADLPASRARGEGAQALTQGFNIVLPFEQAINPSIDVSMELSHFPTRKLMLYQNSLGLVIFPGGFGTLDELLEVWRLKTAGSLDYPLVLFGRDFWEPLGQALRACGAANPSTALPENLYKMLLLTDDPEEAIAHVTAPQAKRAIIEPLAKLGKRIAHELIEGLDFLERLTPAVTVLGGSRLQEHDQAIAHATELARVLARQGVPTRAAGPGNLSVALARGGHAGDEILAQQAFGMRRRDARNLYGADRVHLVSDRLTHKVLLTEGSRAVVALPGGLGTLDELFSVLCQLQTRKVSSRRIILLGSAFWAPLLDTIREQMLNGARQTISAGDLDLLTLTDDPTEAAALALEPPPQLGAKLRRG